MIQRVKIPIGEELTVEVADGYARAALQGREPADSISARASTR
jgi:hypothetical protein